MKSKAFVSIFLIALVHSASAADAASGVDAAKAPDTEVEAEIPADKDDSGASALAKEAANLCFFPGNPSSDVKFKVIKKIKLAKSTYGGVKDLLPRFSRHAQAIGADAIIAYNGSQRFGFWPWRFVRPVVRGTAIKWSNPPSQSCSAMGGTTLSEILSTNKPPAQ